MTNAKEQIPSGLSQHKERHFRVFYNQTIYPELVRLNRVRINLLVSLMMTVLLLIGFIVVAATSKNLPLLILLAIPVGLFFWSTATHYQRYALVFKPRIVNLILDFFDDYVNCENLRFDVKGQILVPKKKLPTATDHHLSKNKTKNKPNTASKEPKKTLYIHLKEHFKKSGFFELKGNDTYEAEDFITGEVGSIAFELAELRITRISRITNSMFVLFHGIFLHSELETRRLRGRLLIIPREEHEFFWRSIQQALTQRMQQADKWIQNASFRQHYLTYANKEVSISRILPEDMQATIMDYRQRTGKALYLAFSDNQAYIAIRRRKDLLEPPYFRSPVRFELIHEFYEDIASLLVLMEAFDQFH